ncbi:MAG TPA: NAD-dependent epimerase/dehydratase family protein [Devosia sp.]|nr:NAD-dependent epimerase/dehydratase family protein [Devosia sp.]
MPTGRVLLTGISGFIGSHVALALLYAGYHVRGSLRDMSRAGEVAQMLERAGADLSRLEFVPLDLMEDAGWREAMRGVRYVQHIASPLTVRMPVDRDELIRPAVEGTRRCLAAALSADVERIVVTSSAAAISYGHPPEKTAFSEADWSNLDAEGISAYTESKTRAELEAWSLAEAAGRTGDLAVINPVVVLGPLLGADHGVSALLIKRLLSGVPFVPRMQLELVDVRDVAALHVNAMTSPRAAGRRHIAAAPPIQFIDLARHLAKSEPRFAARLPRREAPDALVRLYALFDRDARAAVANLGHPRHFDTSAGTALLGRAFISAEAAAAATARSLIELGLVRGSPREKTTEKRG